MLGLLNPEVGNHEYVIPEIGAIPIAAPVGLLIQVINTSMPALATGNPFTTVTVT